MAPRLPASTPWPPLTPSSPRRSPDDDAEAAAAADAAAADADGAAGPPTTRSLLGGAPRGRRSTDRRCGVAVGLALCVVLLLGALAFALAARAALAGQLGLLGRAPPRPDAARPTREQAASAANRTRDARRTRGDPRDDEPQFCAPPAARLAL